MKRPSPLLPALLVAAACSGMPEESAAPSTAGTSATTGQRNIPQPASAASGLSQVLELLESFDGPARVALREARAETVTDLRASLDTHVSVALDLDFLSPDIVTATGAAEALLAELESASWCLGVEYSTMRNLPAGRGIGVQGIRVAVAPGEVPVALAEAPSGVEVHIRRAAAADPAIGPIDTSRSRSADNRGAVDHGYRVKPAVRGKGHPRARVMDFLRRLEDRETGLVLTAVQLELAENPWPNTDLPDAWTFRADLTARTPVPNTELEQS